MRAGLVVLVASVVIVVARPIAQAPAPPTPRAAVARAIPLLQKSAATWTQTAKCFSCHHQGLGATALAVARERGFAIDEAALASELASIRKELPRANVSVDLAPNADYLDDSLGLIALGANGVLRDHGTDRAIHRIIGGQHVAGHWTPYPLRLPLEGSHVAQTAWTMRALQFYGPDSRAADITMRTTRAMDWMSRQHLDEPQDLSMQLLALAWTSAPRSRLEPVGKQLVSLQRKDGGWGQAVARPSDAYATGQALVALHQSAVIKSDAPAFKNAIAFLTSTQREDGSWLTETRRTWRQGLPYFESGYPHGKHQNISFAGAAWAVMALALDGQDRPLVALMGGRRPADDRQSDDENLSLLMRAALYGSSDNVRDELARKPDVNAAATESRLTALMCAAHDARKVALLIAAGADVKAAATTGHTALLLAADYDGARDSVKALLTAGADPNARLKNPNGTPLYRAALRGDRDVAGLLIEAGATVNDQGGGSAALLTAAVQGDTPFVSFMLEHGANIESQVTVSAALMNGSNRPTALMIAADRGAIDMVMMLLKRGANVNARDAQGMTPLMYASGAIYSPGASVGVIKALLVAGADPALRSTAGESATDLAAKYGRADLSAALSAAR